MSRVCTGHVKKEKSLNLKCECPDLVKSWTMKGKFYGLENSLNLKYRFQDLENSWNF